jgi:exopolysaccharide biosynthesis polyprenyl glycosylphosphotransferase
VPSSLPIPRQQPSPSQWARLIPGRTFAFRAGEREPQVASRPFKLEPLESSTARARTRLADLFPAPLQSRDARRWLRSVSADFVSVGLDWLIVGAILVPLRNTFPHIRLIAYAAGSPVVLLGLALLHASLITLVAYTEGLYAGDRNGQALPLGKSVFWATGLLIVAFGLQGAPGTTYVLFSAAGLLHWATLMIRRWHLASQNQPARQAGDDCRSVLIVGAGPLGRRVASLLNARPSDPRVVCGFVDDQEPLGNGVLGRISDLSRLARTLFVDEVILAGPHHQGVALQVIRDAKRLHLDVEIVADSFGCRPVTSELHNLGDLSLILLHEEPLPAAGLALKRFLDIAGAGLVLVALSPLLLLIAALIKLDSYGPVLYCAPRAGRRGRPFRCYKFRTMVAHADQWKDRLRILNQRSGPFFKLADDPRITRFGRLLRKYSLDELPQLWNVLKGDMSLVGPRPHPLDDFAEYEAEHLARLDVTPGLTGLWQITARRDPSFQRGMELDRQYIQSWSLGLDFQILLKTFSAVVRGGGE